MFKEILNPDCVVELGDKVTISSGVVLGKNCKEVKIGYGSYIGRDIYIDVESLEIGEYTTIHHGSVLHGINTRIGHNCWIGHYSIVDSLGGQTILGNNVGVGAHSQLWSHMKFGDVLAGCRWNSSSKLQLDDDVWLVGHSIVGPIHAERRSMLLTGSVALKNMKENVLYRGSPATPIERLGGQFNQKPLEKIVREFNELKEAYSNQTDDVVDIEDFVSVEEFSIELYEAGVTQFDLERRLYMPTYKESEHSFIKYLLYDKAKFIPVRIDEVFQ